MLFATSKDQLELVQALQRQKKRYQAPIYAWTGMHNHHHIFNQVPTQWHSDTEYARNQSAAGKSLPFGYVLRDIHSLFARRFNLQNSREGGVIKDRSKSIIVGDDAQALTLLIYIFLNPVRAGIVKHPKDYPHSSFPQYSVGKRTFGNLFSYHPAYLGLGSSPRLRQRRFNQLIEAALRQWAMSRWPGASGSHGRGPKVGEKAREDFKKLSKAWVTLNTLSPRAPPTTPIFEIT